MPSLSSFGALREALHAALDDERGDAARAGLRIGLGVDDKRLGDGAVGDPHLRAIEDVAVALAGRPRRHRHDVGAGVRLRHRQRADMLAGNELRQIARLLAGVAVAHDLVDAEVRMRAIRKPDRAARARHFLHRHAMLEVAEPKPAVFLRRRDPVQAERAHFRPEVERKEVLAVDRRGARRDLLLGESAGAVSDHRGALAEVEIERTGRVGDHGLALQGGRRIWRQSAAFGKAAGRAAPGLPGESQAGSKFSQIQQNPAKPEQRKSKENAWISLDSLVRIEPFQKTCADPQAFFLLLRLPRGRAQIPAQQKPNPSPSSPPPIGQIADSGQCSRSSDNQKGKCRKKWLVLAAEAGIYTPIKAFLSCPPLWA